MATRLIRTVSTKHTDCAASVARLLSLSYSRVVTEGRGFITGLGRSSRSRTRRRSPRSHQLIIVQNGALARASRGKKSQRGAKGGGLIWLDSVTLTPPLPELSCPQNGSRQYHACHAIQAVTTFIRVHFRSAQGAAARC